MNDYGTISSAVCFVFLWQDSCSYPNLSVETELEIQCMSLYVLTTTGRINHYFIQWYLTVLRRLLKTQSTVWHRVWSHLLLYLHVNLPLSPATHVLPLSQDAQHCALYTCHCDAPVLDVSLSDVKRRTPHCLVRHLQSGRCCPKCSVAGWMGYLWLVSGFMGENRITFRGEFWEFGRQSSAGVNLGRCC